MDKLKKIGLTALSTALVSTAAQAADLSVTGSANLFFNGAEQADSGNTWSSSDTITFAGSGDLDNGWTVSMATALNGDGSSNASSISINTNGFGSLKFETNDSGLPVESTDDMMPNAGPEESWDGGTAPTTGADGAKAFLYSNSDVVDGLTIQLGYMPSNLTTQVKSSTEYGLTYTGIEGLTVGYAWGDDESASGTTIENANLYAKYAYDAFTIGIQANSSDDSRANSDKDFEAMGISYAVSEDLSVSVNVSTIDYESSTLQDQEATGIGVSWTSGGLTVSASHNTIDNKSGTASSDVKTYEIAFGFAF